MALNVLHQGLLKKGMQCPFSRLGGAVGMRLTRAAFGAMLKFCDQIDQFLKLVEDVNFTSLDISKDEDAPIGDKLASAIAL